MKSYRVSQSLMVMVPTDHPVRSEVQDTVNISRSCKTLSLRAGGCKAKAHWNEERRNRVMIRTSG